MNADLLEPESLEKAIEGCEYVVHTASPFPAANPKDENEIIRPAVEGTLAVLRAAHKHRVKRVVITSSVAALINQAAGEHKSIYTEEDWTNPTVCEPYEKSKALAEKAAWDFVKDLPEDEKFELVTVLPGFIMGPTLVKTDFTSGDIIRNMIMGNWIRIPRLQFPMVDVRDCAFGHLQALKLKEAANKRFTLATDSMWFIEMVQLLHKNYG
jgi:nucleoside-diphosphate-sugar epimerase